MLRKLRFKILLAIFVVASVLETASAGEGLVFIVHPDNKSESISETLLRDFYLKRVKSWPDGTSVRFIDRTPDSDLRTQFLAQIIKKTTVDLDLYWINQQ